MTKLLEERFENAFIDLEKHNAKPEVMDSSDYRIAIDCDAYRKIISMGKGVLPLLKDKIGRGARWSVLHAIYEVLRNENIEFEVPEEIRGKLGEMEKYTSRFLERMSEKGAEQ